MLTITAHASSSAGNLYVLDNGISQLILELGKPWKKVKQALNFDLSRAAGAFVTHEHQDHAKAVRDAAKAGIDIYMSKGTAEAIGATGHRITHIHSGQQITIGGSGWHIRPFDVEHDAAEPLGFLIVTGQEKILFLTDTAYCRYRFKGITRLIIECNFSNEILERNFMAGTVEASRRKRLLESHMSLERVVDFLAVNDISALKEIHLIHLSDQNSDETLFKSEIQKITGLPVFICPR